MYSDGTLAYDDPNDCAAVIGYAASNPKLVIGWNDARAGSRCRTLAIDEFAIFERALTADEIGVIYKSKALVNMPLWARLCVHAGRCWHLHGPSNERAAVQLC